MRASNDFTAPDFTTLIPDRQAIAGFDALLAGLDPDVAHLVLRDCLAEIALWQHRLRVQERHYAADARPREMFHIG